MGNVFIKMVIHLKGPLCDCLQQNLEWQVGHEEGDEDHIKHTLLLTCKTCATSIVIPHHLFKAAIEPDEKYPGGIKPDRKSSRKPKVDIDVSGGYKM